MLLRHYPIARLGLFQRDMDQVLDSVFDGFEGLGLRRARVFPPLNVWENGDCAYVEAEVPGLGLDDLEIHVTGNELTIEGQRDDTPDEDLKYHHRERCVGKFARRITLPYDVEVGQVEATLKDGLLTVKLPKAEAAKSRKIAVTSN